jgi:hypothetical protein
VRKIFDNRSRRVATVTESDAPIPDWFPLLAGAALFDIVRDRGIAILCGRNTGKQQKPTDHD